LLVYLVYAAVIGGTLALAFLSFRSWPLPVALLSQEWAQRLHDRKSGIPYGVALAIGALLIYPDTEWMKAIDFSRFV
jgi:prepilin peptidase CpaA